MAGYCSAIPIALLLLVLICSYCCGVDTSLDDEFDDEFEDEFADKEVSRPSDPFRLYNRFMFRINDRLYFWMMKPVAVRYSKVVPEGGRIAVNRFFRNITFPIRFVNNVLQLKFKNAAVEFARFGVNTTVGVLGFGDPARRLGLTPRSEDFGQTLGRYGAGSGFHLVLPILGPSNLRDAVGRLSDGFLNPINYVDPPEAALIINAYGKENYTSLHIGEYESLKKDALDPYTFIRDAYEQNRKKMIEE